MSRDSVRGRFLGLVALVLVCTVFPSASPASDRPAFLFSFEGFSPVEISGATEGDWHSAALSVRTQHGRPADPAVTLRGRALTLVVDRYEATWPERNLTPLQGRVQMEDVGRPEPTSTEFHDVEFHYNLTNPGAAAILVTDSMHWTSRADRYVVESTTLNPHLVHGLPMRTPGTAKHEDERRLWWMEGAFAVVRPPSMGAVASGATHFYWTNSTLRLDTEAGPVWLESYTWSDPVVDAGRARLRHAVWYELRAGAANVSFTYAPTADDVRTVAYVQQATIRGVQALAIDSTTRVNGTFPVATQLAGSSLWIRGNMTIHQKVHPPPSADEGGPPIYSVAVEGKGAAFSVGGGPIVEWVPSAAVTASAAGILVVVVLILRYALGIGQYAKIDKKDLLKHAGRDAILRLIQHNPGIPFSALRLEFARALGRPSASGPLVHHLAKLEHNGFITSRREGRYRRYFVPAAGNPVARERIALLQTPPVDLIAAAILANPGTSQQELLSRVRERRVMTRSNLQYHLQRLLRAGLVEATVAGRERRYSAKEPMASLLLPAPGAPSTGALRVGAPAEGVAG